MKKTIYGTVKKQWLIEGSKGNKYFVNYDIHSRRTWACQCPHQQFRKTDCIHITRIKIAHMIDNGINLVKHYSKEQLEKSGSIQTAWMF